MTLQPNPTDIRRDLVSLLPRLRRFALALCGQPNSVDELVREACGRAVLQASPIEPGGRLESWVFAIIRAIWNDPEARRRLTADEGAGDGFADHGAILSLPAGAAASFLLVVVEEHSYVEAADILDIDRDLVATQVALARRIFAVGSVEQAERWA